MAAFLGRVSGRNILQISCRKLLSGCLERGQVSNRHLVLICADFM